MLKSDRKKVSRWISTLEELPADLESMVSALDDKVSIRSERFAESDKGQVDAECLSYLHDALSGVESALDSFCSLPSEE